jgi:hypothetical protein
VLRCRGARGDRGKSQQQPALHVPHAIRMLRAKPYCATRALIGRNGQDPPEMLDEGAAVASTPERRVARPHYRALLGIELARPERRHRRAAFLALPR